jgi:hypothetical protein
MRRSLGAWLRGDMPVSRLDPVRSRCIEAYDLVERLPRGPERSAAWAAYALLTYGDKLVVSTRDDGYVDADTARVARTSFELAERCLEPGGAVPQGLPRWQSGVRSYHQLRGMRETLEALRTFLAFDLREQPDAGFAEALAAVDRHVQKVSSLWIARPTAELRGGIGDALVIGLDEAYALGRAMAARR